MEISLLAPPAELLAGLAIGLFFGFFLQKAGVTRRETIIAQLLLKDFTVMKVILTAIALGSLSLYTLKAYLLEVDLIISSTTLMASFLGGGLFGIGMALLGYCPGTCVGALAEGSKEAFWGFGGMILGAALYARAFAWITLHLKPDHEINASTLSQYLSLPAWIFIAAACLGVGLLKLSESWHRAPRVKK